MLLSLRVDSQNLEHVIKLKGQKLVNKDIEMEVKCNRNNEQYNIILSFSTH